MSPRAACRLERFGFAMVYDYVGGIADWKAAGLPLEGDAPPVQRVADATRPDVPTCDVDELVGVVRERTFESGWDECVVVDCDGLVVGRLRDQTWDAEDDVLVGRAMQSGPTTVRPDGLLQPLVDRMTQRSTKMVVVTNAQGQLLGVLLHDEAERVLSGEPPEQIWRDCEGCPGQWRVVAGV